MHFGQLEISRSTRSIVLHGMDLRCTEVEFDLLWLLASHAGEVVDRDLISRELNGYEHNGLDRSVDIRISRIIKTIRGNTCLQIAPGAKPDLKNDQTVPDSLSSNYCNSSSSIL